LTLKEGVEETLTEAVEETAAAINQSNEGIEDKPESVKSME
jgi:hypothetical protein